MADKSVFEMIYDVVRRIPCGKVATYGQIAMLAGNPRWARAVGYALHANPEPGIIPCHRVLNRFGKTAPAFAFGGSDRRSCFVPRAWKYPRTDSWILTGICGTGSDI